MSADNWAHCPRCAVLRAAKVSAAEDAASLAYGKVSVFEFDALKDKAAAIRDAQVECTFREDYEFYGADEGVLEVRYSGSCSVCGLSHTFTASDPLDVGESR